jgi:broad specificity phosphatase PhoE
VTRPARILLVRHAPTPATRRHAFPCDEPLDDRGREAAARLAGHLGADRVVSSPALRCRETAAAVGLAAPVLDPRWAELDFGRWAGRTLDEVASSDPAGLEAWLRDPSVAPPGGESLPAVRERVTAAMTELAAGGGTTVVVTSGGPVKIAVLTALAAPSASLWNVDVAPCSVTTLHARPDGGWTLRSLNEPVPSAVPA